MAAETVPERLVHAHVYDPSQPSIFKKSANDKAVTFVTYCKLASCPLHDAGFCTLRTAPFPDKCPYGRNGGEIGPTRRAAKFHQWVRDRKKQYEGIPYLKTAPRRMAFIGDYAYLPYAHMTMCKTVEFLSHTAFIIAGNPFLPLASWTVETVIRLIDFCPQAIMGGVIDNYQRKEVPKFLQHLRECDPAMWAKLIAARPELDTAPNYVGRKAILRTLNAPIALPAEDARYPVEWTWDGERVRTTGISAYQSTWGGVELGSMELVGVPSASAVIEVKDNSWVNDSTVFTD